jgi:hypothetical protein
MSINQTSLLAKLLATENITVQQQPNVKTAMFDLRNRTLILPIWQGISRDLEDLLIVHETGHALDTPGAEEYKAAADRLAAKIFPNEKISNKLRSTIQGFVNVIEDARIDKRQKRRYPGSRKNYLIGYKELVDRDFFGTANRDINTMNFIDRLNLYFKGGNIHYNITFTPEEKVLLKKVEDAETFADVEILSEEIYLFCKQKLEDQQEMEIDLLSEESEDEDGDNDIDGDDFDWSESDDDSEDETSASSGESEEGEGDIEPTPGGDGAAPSGDGAAPSDLPANAPVSHTDETWQKKSEEIVKSENSVFVYVTKPDVNWDKALHDYKKVLEDWRGSLDTPTGWDWQKFTTEQFHQARQDLTAWRTQEKQSISFLVKEFEQRKAAEMYAKINVAKTGVIDTNKLHTYKYNDDIFRRIATIPQGKNHGFVMFLDWSGSMQQGLNHTMKQLFSLCLFCKQIGVPFEVYAFKDCGAEHPFSYLNKENVIGSDNLVLRNFLSSRMNVEELNFAMTCLWHLGHGGHISSEGMGGTPLNDALLIAPKVINDFTARNKLEITNVIVLTDGESNPSAGIKNETAPRVHGQSRKYFYVDPATRKTYDWQPYGWGYGQGNTNTLLRIIKDSTGCNLVGFYLYGYSFKRLDRDFNVANGNPEALVKARKYWNENKYYPIRSAGYDEYYIIDTNSLRDTNNELAIDNTGDKKMTTKKMVSAFTKFAQKKTINRVLLRQFSERIAGHSKKVA